VKKCIIYLCLISFFYVSHVRVLSCYQTSFSLNSASALTVTAEKQNELVDTCLAENDDLTEEDCIENVNESLEDLNQTVIALDDKIHGTSTHEDWAMFVGVLLNIVSYVLVFCKHFPLYSTKPSFWLGVGAHVVLFFWYFGSLVLFSDYTTNLELATDQEIEKLEDMTIDKETDVTLDLGIKMQIEALESVLGSVENFKNALKTAVVLLYSGAAFAIIECVWCWLINTWCEVPKKIKKNPIKNLLDFLLYKEAKADFEDKKMKQAKEQSKTDGDGFEVSAWTRNIFEIVAIVWLNDPGDWIDMVMDQATMDAGKWIACALRAGYMAWDATNYESIHSSWEETEREIKKRIAVLQKARDIINNSLESNGPQLSPNNNNNDRGGNLDSPTDSNLSFNDGDDGNLGGICLDADPVTGESKRETSKEECSDNNFEIPKQSFDQAKKQLSTNFPEGVDFTEDVIEDLESIENGINSRDSVAVDANASIRRAKNIIPKLLRLKRKIEKEKKLPKSKDFLDSFIEAGNLRIKQQDRLASFLKDKGISLKTGFGKLSKKLSRNKDEVSKKTSKLSVHDDKKINSLGSYKLGGKVLKRKNKKTTDKLRSDALSKYKIKHDDINKKKGVSIWKLINNRYLQSGYPRLFEKE